MRTFQVTKPRRLVIDPLVRALTAKGIDDDVATFKHLLDARRSEQAIQSFLERRSYFFNGALRLFAPSPLYSKVKLGSDHEVDFAWFDSGSYGPEWHLVEIEAPRSPAFNKSGEPSATLYHALQQVRDWHAWVNENHAYVKKLMPQITYPRGVVFVGRRRDLSRAGIRRLKRLAYDNRMSVELHSLDWLSDAAASVKALLKPSGGCWPVPMSAFTHQQLARGEPRRALRWLREYDPEDIDNYRGRLLQEREAGSGLDYGY